MKTILHYSMLIGGMLMVSASAHALVPVKVPEPSSLALLGLALVLAGIAGRKK